MRRNGVRLTRADYAVFVAAGMLTGAGTTFGQLWLEAGAPVVAVVPLGLLAYCVIWGAAILAFKAIPRPRR